MRPVNRLGKIMIGTAVIIVTGVGRFFKFLLLLVAILAFNIATYVVPTLADAMLDLTRRLSMTPAVSAASQLTEARSQIQLLRTQSQKLEQENTTLVKLNDAAAEKARELEGKNSKISKELTETEGRNAALRAENAKLTTARDQLQKSSSQLEIDFKQEVGRTTNLSERLNRMEEKNRTLAKTREDLSDQLRRSRNQLLSARHEIDRLQTMSPGLSRWQAEEVDHLTSQIMRRSARNAARNLSSIPLESVPILGVLTITAVTALEINDACYTIKEMEELRHLTGLSMDDPGILSQACSLVVPAPDLPRNMTLKECRAHAQEVRSKLGPEVAQAIDNDCECLALPDGCPLETDIEDIKSVQMP